jgi:hypothetical protein
MSVTTEELCKAFQANYPREYEIVALGLINDRLAGQLKATEQELARIRAAEVIDSSLARAAAAPELVTG